MFSIICHSESESIVPTFLAGFIKDFLAALRVALWPTVHAVYREPTMLLHPLSLRRFFFAQVWTSFSQAVDDGGRAVKQGLITPHAYGVVLDVGAGHGHTMLYLDRSRVTKYIALEPNRHMHMAIRRTAASCGFSEFDGTLVILPIGAEDAPSVLEPRSVDTLVSILTLCSIPDGETTIRSLVQTSLKPGGQFLFYEHVDSPLQRVRWWQRALSPIWAACFDGCTLGLPSHLWIERAGSWSTHDVWGKEGESNDNMFYHKVGRYVLAKDVE